MQSHLGQFTRNYTQTTKRGLLTTNKGLSLIHISTLEGLGKLKPVFWPENGTVTAGNASGMNDGAAFEIFTKESTARERGLEVMAKVAGYAIAGCNPKLMGMGPVPAIREVLKNHQMTLEDIDILEDVYKRQSQ